MERSAAEPSRRPPRGDLPGTDRGRRTGLWALLVGYHDGGDLRYAGKVGTGFDQATLGHLSRLLAARERSTRNVRGCATGPSVAAIDSHTWLVRADALDRPDQLVFDLDPPGEDIAAARAAARRVRDVLDELEPPHLRKTSGSKGDHVHVLIDREDEIDARSFAASLRAR